MKKSLMVFLEIAVITLSEFLLLISVGSFLAAYIENSADGWPFDV